MADSVPLYLCVAASTRSIYLKKRANLKFVENHARDSRNLSVKKCGDAKSRDPLPMTNMPEAM